MNSLNGFPKLLTIALALLITQISCDKSEDPITPDPEIKINLASALRDTVWNQLAIDYSIESDRKNLLVNLIVDNTLIKTINDGDEIIINTKDFSDGVHDIELEVLSDNEKVGSFNQEVYFLNTLAIGEFGEYLVNGRKGYVLLDYQGTTIDYAEIINNSTIIIPRPDDFDERNFNITVITILNGEWSQYLFYTTKNVLFWEYKSEEFIPDEYTHAEFDFINLPSEYNYFTVSAGSYHRSGAPDNLLGPLENRYSFNYSAHNDFYMYVSENESDRYFYIDNLDNISNESTLDFNQSSTDMDAYSLNFNYPVYQLLFRMRGQDQKFRDVYGYFMDYSRDRIPTHNFEFSLPRLENFESYDVFEVHQSLSFKDKNLNIRSKHSASEIPSIVDLVGNVDFDFTYTYSGLDQMDIDVQGEVDYVEFNVRYQRPTDFAEWIWSVNYENYNDEHSFPQIPKEIIEDINVLINDFDYKGTDVTMGKTTVDGITYEMVD